MLETIFIVQILTLAVLAFQIVSEARKKPEPAVVQTEQPPLIRVVQYPAPLETRPSSAHVEPENVRTPFFDQTSWQVLRQYIPPGPPAEGEAEVKSKYRLEGWVREGSPAWQAAYDSPGIYLKRYSPTGEETELIGGIQ